ncbi:hypothetical protein D3C86_1102320 [compost metagenome]
MDARAGPADVAAVAARGVVHRQTAVGEADAVHDGLGADDGDAGLVGLLVVGDVGGQVDGQPLVAGPGQGAGGVRRDGAALDLEAVVAGVVVGDHPGPVVAGQVAAADSKGAADADDGQDQTGAGDDE